jgi:uncharacterized protein (TIGR02001 family)
MTHPRAMRLIAMILAGWTPLAPVRAAGSWGGSVAVTTNYIYHGLSQSNDNPAVQADLHYRMPLEAVSSEAFFGVWSSTISRATTGGTYEVNAYAGSTLLINPSSSATLTYVHYAYPDDRGRRRYDYDEPRYGYDELSGTWAFRDQVFLSVAWAPNMAGYSERGLGRCCRRLSYGLALHQSLGRAWTLSAGLGYDQLLRVPGYGFANVGIAYAVGKAQFDVSYFATQSRAERAFGETLAGRRWVGTLVWRF